MTNIIEIRIKASDDTKTAYDAAKAKAAEAGAAAGAAYYEAYNRMATSEMITPSRVTSARRSPLADLGPTPEEIAQQKAQIAALEREMSDEAERAFEEGGAKDVLDPSGPTGTKIKQDAKKTAQEAGQGMSPLIGAAIGGAAAIGAPLLLAGMGVAFAGVTALALKNNVVIKNDFANVAQVAEKSFTDAAAPLAGTMHQALLGLGQTATQIEPQLQGMFANVEPDITTVTTGVEGFVKSALPGLSSALGSSQVIVADFAGSLPGLGQHVGGFFQGLTRDANTTGAGMSSLIGTVGNLAETLGGVLGSAASVGSTALMGLDPVLNTTLDIVQKLASPGVVGAGGGLFAAFKLDPAISGGLKSAAGGMESLALKSMDATGVFGRMAPALEKTSGALSKGASIMGGPWGLAIGAGVGLAVGLTGALINAAKASDALTLSQQGLDQAVAKDNGHIGQATSAYVAAQAQADGLAKSAAAAGVSLATWTQAVLGNTDAQKLVTDAVTTSNQSTLNQQVITDGAARSTGKFADEQRDAQTAVAGTSSATGRLTDQNKQLLASMDAQNKQIAAAITKQQQLQAATNALTNATTIFAASLKAQYTAQVASQQQSAINTIASLNLGDANTQLSQSLYDTVDAFGMAQAGGNSYLSVLDALSGDEIALLGTEAAFTTSLSNLTKTTKGHTDSLDVNTAAGAANITKMTQIAQAADKAAAAVFQNEQNTKGASVAYNDANAKLAQEKAAFIAAADSAGYNKDEVQKLADQLFQLPKNISPTVGLNTAPAYNSLGRLLNTIDSSSASVTVLTHGPAQASYATGGNYGGAAATGGARGNIVKVGERGTEFVRLPFGSTVIPHSNVQSMESSGNGLGTAPGRGGGPAPLVLEIVGGDAELVALFRKIIRVRGGNVQKVLGVG